MPPSEKGTIETIKVHELAGDSEVAPERFTTLLSRQNANDTKLRHKLINKA
jgi:hypothetical protein